MCSQQSSAIKSINEENKKKNKISTGQTYSRYSPKPNKSNQTINVTEKCIILSESRRKEKGLVNLFSALEEFN